MGQTAFLQNAAPAPSYVKLGKVKLARYFTRICHVVRLPPISATDDSRTTSYEHVHTPI